MIARLMPYVRGARGRYVGDGGVARDLEEVRVVAQWQLKVVLESDGFGMGEVDARLGEAAVEVLGVRGARGATSKSSEGAKEVAWGRKSTVKAREAS